MLGAQHFQITGQQSVRARLDQHIADSGGFDGACDRPGPRPDRRRVDTAAWFWAPPPTICTVFAGVPESSDAVSTLSAKAAARLSMIARAVSATVVGAFRPRARYHAAMRLGMSPGVWKVASSVSNTSLGGGHAAACSRSSTKIDAGAAALPVSDRFAQQPEPHDVAQEADSSVGADFVGEVGRPGRLGQHRSVQFDADESPGATRDVDRGLRCHGYGHHRRGGVVRGDRADVRLTGQTEPRCEVRQNWAQIGAWVNDAGEQSGGYAKQSPSTRHPIGRRCRAIR